MGFRFEIVDSAGRLVVAFEEQENLELGAWELVAAYCDPSVSSERWQRLERLAVAEWIRHDPASPEAADSSRMIDITQTPSPHRSG
jgi:hypothetical protein